MSLRPPHGFNPRPRCLSTPTDAFQLHPDIRSYRTALTTGDATGTAAELEWGPDDDEAYDADAADADAAKGTGIAGGVVNPHDVWRAFNEEDDDDMDDGGAGAGAGDGDARLEIVRVDACPTLGVDPTRPDALVETMSDLQRHAVCATVEGGIGLAHGVHCVVAALARDADGASRRATHASTMPAFAYVAKGKPNRRFVLASLDGTCGVVVETRASAFVYRAAAGGSKGEHQIFDPKSSDPCVGARLLDADDGGGGKKHLLVLTKSAVFVLGIRAWREKTR